MIFYAFKRLFMSLLVALVVSMISFSLAHFSGNIAVAIAGPSGTAADIARIREQYGLNRPLPVQYYDWLTNILHGDLGTSLYYREPVWDLLKTRLPVTMTLGACALAFALILAVPLGVLSALKPNTWVDRLSLLISVTGQAIPTFWFGLLMMLLFAVSWGILPVSGTQSWKNFVMPTIALGYYATPAFMRLTRTGMLEVLDSDFIRQARAKGFGAGQFCSNTRCVMPSCLWCLLPPYSLDLCSGVLW